MMQATASPAPALDTSGVLEEIRAYWNERIHDLEVVTQPIGSAGFFQELDEYRFDKLRYLPLLVNFSSYSGKTILEVGCGVGTDLARFASGGALVTGVDLAERSIELARRNFAHLGLNGSFEVMNGESLEYESDSFDVVYAHGVLQYTARPEAMVAEIHRVLKPGGEAILMVYNRRSWLNLLSRFAKVELEHEDAPVLRKFTIAEFKDLLTPFPSYRIVPERFPVRTRLHHGLKATLYNEIFVRAFEWLPKRWVRPTGWHLMAFAVK